MPTPGEPKPVKLFAALLASDADLFSAVATDLAALFGPLESASEVFPWSLTDYYEAEMGRGLVRRFVAFAPPISPERLAAIKHQTRAVEDRYRQASGSRRVNIDPGYLDAGKVVLASTKDAGHRVYLGEGIYGELTLLYYERAFHPLPYTYPDYRWPETLAFLAAARERFLAERRENSRR